MSLFRFATVWNNNWIKLSKKHRHFWFSEIRNPNSMVDFDALSVSMSVSINLLHPVWGRNFFSVQTYGRTHARVFIPFWFHQEWTKNSLAFFLDKWKSQQPYLMYTHRETVFVCIYRYENIEQVFIYVVWSAYVQPYTRVSACTMNALLTGTGEWVCVCVCCVPEFTLRVLSE